MATKQQVSEDGASCKSSEDEVDLKINLSSATNSPMLDILCLKDNENLHEHQASGESRKHTMANIEEEK